jgi:hypothetical protein
MSLKTLRTTSFLTALAGAALLIGCFATGARDVHRQDRYRDRDRDSRSAPGDDDENRIREVRGTVERVDPVNHRIDLAQGERIADHLAIYYDPSTRGHESRRFRPQDLRPGDRIRAEVEPTHAGLMIQQLEVLSEARGGAAPEVREVPADRPAPEVREGPDAREVLEPPGVGGDSRPAVHLRGTVRYVDTSARTLEIEPSPGQGRPGRVRVQYDDDTGVESQGKRSTPDNLQLGDRVEIDLRDDHGGQRLLAGQIVVVHGGQTEEH